jgi:hypothetical protein
LVHDFSDLFLESGKCLNYLSKTKKYKFWASKATDCMFGIFALSFFITRLIIYPRYLVYSLLFEAPIFLGYWNGYWFLGILLVILQCLHVFWFYLILRMVYKILIVGEVEKDERSDDEEDGDEVENDDSNDDLVNLVKENVENNNDFKHVDEKNKLLFATNSKTFKKKLN